TRAGADLDAHPTCRTTSWRQIELWPYRPVGDKGSAVKERRQTRAHRGWSVDTDPGRGRTESILMAKRSVRALQVMGVASADGGAANASAEKSVPARQRRRVELRPRPVPDLDRIEAALVR